MCGASLQFHRDRQHRHWNTRASSVAISFQVPGQQRRARDVSGKPSVAGGTLAVAGLRQDSKVMR